MADVSQLVQALAAMKQQQPAPAMLADQGAPDFQSLLKYPDSTPAGAIREINPGITWGGKDKNAVHPFDVQMNRVFGIPLQTAPL